MKLRQGHDSCKMYWLTWACHTYCGAAVCGAGGGPCYGYYWTVTLFTSKCYQWWEQSVDIVSICLCLHKRMLCSQSIDCCRLGVYQFLTGFAKTRHYDAFLEIQIFASVSYICLKLCSVVISMLYCKEFSNSKAR